MNSISNFISDFSLKNCDEFRGIVELYCWKTDANGNKETLCCVSQDYEFVVEIDSGNSKNIKFREKNKKFFPNGEIFLENALYDGNKKLLSAINLHDGNTYLMILKGVKRGGHI